jgi:signal transduction histidine kinase
MIVGCYLYIRKRIINPFHELKDFAVRVAGGNLDIPLTMNKGQIFGNFTEAFDIMRSELKKARLAEKKANDDKKETIAKLSHDIKTPIASIKSTSELGMEMAEQERTKKKFSLINTKCDQVTTLVDNLFNSSIDEVTQIAVSPVVQPSERIGGLIKNADYLGKAGEFSIPDCNVFMDKLRLQQAFDNIFMNSYKYADTSIDVKVEENDEYLIITVSDFGEGVSKDELPLLKGKYNRGSNITEKEGAGLGLYLTDYFLTSMDGKLELESNNGFSVILYIRKANYE